jgi:UDP-N-acetylglucosamine--N-acetylmuramyl-(pentapeptide) pyrophosphoryl-undecaprenol N-acetylglucosamine transferase
MTGNPVREDILNLDGKREEGAKHFGLDLSRPVLLVMGGSLGARSINESIEEGIEAIRAEGVQLIWQTGKSFYERARIFEGHTIKVVEFIDRMDLAYAVSDAVVSRAGALAISELAIVGKPSILVPSPNVAEDHQTKNALSIVSLRACLLVNDDLARTKLVETAMMLIKNDNLKKELGENIAKLAIRDSAQRIAEEVIRLALD